MARTNTHDVNRSFTRRALASAVAAVLMSSLGATGAIAGEPCELTWNLTPGTPGAGATVHALLRLPDAFGAGPRIVAGGDFTTIDGAPIKHLAMWDGTTWHALGEGVNGPVYALALHDDGAGPALYVAGAFTSAGGTIATNIARWDGAQWSPLGAGVDADVYALCVHDEGDGQALFAGGAFTTAGGASAFRVARWKNGAWSPLSIGMTGAVRALVVRPGGAGAGLHAFGGFGMAGGVNAANAARWDGAQWSPLGAGLNGTVEAAAIDPADGSVVVGGAFSNAGGAGAARVARWNGAAWSAVGAGFNERVRAVAFADLGDGAGPTLYAGGEFILSGGAFVPHVARWNGAAWQALASNMTGGVRALCPDAGATPGALPSLWLGGAFTTIGTDAVQRIARIVGCDSDAPLPPCPGDTNGDRVVNFDDLSDVLSAFGLIGAPGQYPGDLNGDGAVNFDDLALVLGAFGTFCD